MSNLFSNNVNSNIKSQSTIPNININTNAINNDNNSIFSQIKIHHWNCKFIKNRYTDIIDYLNFEKPDILCLNEVGLKNPKILNEWFYNIKYNMIHKLRPKSKGGGIMLRIRDEIQFEEITTNSILIKIKIKLNHEFHLSAYYNAPHKKINETLITNMINKYKNLIIIGDLNAHLTMFGANKNNCNGNILENILEKTNAILINDNNKTYHQVYTSKKKNCTYLYDQTLDYAIATPNMANKFDSFTVIKDSILQSDHYPIACNFNIERTVSNTNTTSTNNKLPNQNANNETQTKKIFNFEIANWEHFKNTMESICAIENENNNIEISSLSFDDLNTFITKIINETTNKAVPCINIKPQGEVLSCLPNYLVNIKKERNKFQKKYHRTKKVEFKTKYYELRNKFEIELSKFKSKQWEKFMQDLNTKQPLSSKVFWKRINRIRTQKKSN